MPVIPTGSEMPRCWSTTYSCGMSCSSSWSRPSDTARATSFTRATSSAVISSADPATTPVDVLAGDAAGHRAHLHARQPLGIAHRGDDRTARLVDIAHHAPAHARVLREPHPQHLGERHAREVPHDLGDHGARLGAAEIEPGHDLPISGHAPPSPAPSAVALRRTITWPA